MKNITDFINESIFRPFGPAETKDALQNILNYLRNPKCTISPYHIEWYVSEGGEHYNDISDILKFMSKHGDNGLSGELEFYRAITPILNKYNYFTSQGDWEANEGGSYCDEKGISIDDMKKELKKSFNANKVYKKLDKTQQEYLINVFGFTNADLEYVVCKPMDDGNYGIYEIAYLPKGLSAEQTEIVKTFIDEWAKRN